MKRKSLFTLFVFLLIFTQCISAQTADQTGSPENDPPAAADPVTPEEILSVHSVYGDPDKAGDVQDLAVIDGVCYFDQRNACNLYRNSLEDPDALTAGEKQIVEDIVSLLEQYGITDEEQRDYLLLVASASGCGYALPVEILLDRYLNDPDAFEEKFGYPLYYVNGSDVEYNLDTIFVDIFLKTNLGEIQKIVNEKDTVVRMLTVFGMNFYDTDIRFNEMESIIHTVLGPETEVLAVSRDLSVKTYNKYVVQGEYDYACIAAHAFVLKPYGANPYGEDYISDGGHWMRVKGTVGKKITSYQAGARNVNWQIILPILRKTFFPFSLRRRTKMMGDSFSSISMMTDPGI